MEYEIIPKCERLTENMLISKKLINNSLFYKGFIINLFYDTLEFTFTLENQQTQWHEWN